MRTVTELLDLGNPDNFSYEERVKIVEETVFHVDHTQKCIRLLRSYDMSHASLTATLAALQMKLKLFHLWASTTGKFGEVGPKTHAARP